MCTTQACSTRKCTSMPESSSGHPSGAGTPFAGYRPRSGILDPVSSAEVKNLEAISKAIDQHNSSCPYPAAEVRMNPFEVERLGWDEIRGLPLVADPDVGTGRFVIVCSRDADGQDLEETEAVGEEYVTVAPSPGSEPGAPGGPGGRPGVPGWN